MRPSRWIVVAVVIASALVVLSIQAYAAFTGTATDDLAVGAATMHLAFGTPDRLSIPVEDLEPASTAQRAVDIEVVGSPEMRNASISSVATTSSLLDTDADNGLQLSIDACDDPWDETLDGDDVPVEYSCPGVEAEVVSERPVVFAHDPSSFDLTPGATNHLLVTLRLPETAPGNFAGLHSVIDLTFLAHQPDPGFR